MISAGLVTIQPLVAAEPVAATAPAIGVPLAGAEADEAWQFCLATLLHAARRHNAARTCGCFPQQWAMRTSRLHRLALRIALAPESHDAHTTLGTISHLQGGLHDASLQILSDGFKSAARNAIEACER